MYLMCKVFKVLKVCVEVVTLKHDSPSSSTMSIIDSMMNTWSPRALSDVACVARYSFSAVRVLLLTLSATGVGSPDTITCTYCK